LFLRTGNAGALDIAVDGKNAPGIGAVGAMRRKVALDPDALLAGTAVHG
jgi:cytoskeleton protein RodZ